MHHLLVVLTALLLFTAAPAVADERSGLPNCPDDQSQRYDGCFGTYEVPNGDRYVGEWRDDKYHGQGTYTFADGEKYVGEFRGGKQHGYGTLTFGPESDFAGDTYVGEFEDGKYHGQGTYTFSDGEKYVAEFQDGERHGQGIRYSPDGTVLEEGYWESDELVRAEKVEDSDGRYVGRTELPECPDDQSQRYDGCFGTYALPNGDEYVGEWRNDEPHGGGTYKFADGSEYVGEYRQGKWHGHGSHTFADGQKFVGEFKDGERLGQGVLYAADGTVLEEGYWESDELVRAEKIEGSDERHAGRSGLPNCPDDQSQIYDGCFGTYTFSDGDEYVGEWRNDEPQGDGTYTFADGDKYVGEVKDGNKHGHGAYAFADGAEYVGEYRDGAATGQGTYTWPGGAKYVGEFKDGLSHGYGTLFAADGTVLKQCYWENDELVRAEKVEDGDGGHAERSSALPECPDDPRQRYDGCFGIYTAPNGDEYVGEWKDDKPHGDGTITYSNGNRYVGEFGDGHPNGDGAYTYAHGDKYIGEITDGEPNGSGTYAFADGDKYVGEIKNGKKHGQGTYTFADGETFVGHFEDGARRGHGISYGSDGAVLEAGYWENNELVRADKDEVSDGGHANRSDSSSEIIPASSGTGFLVSVQGHIVTNQHVIDGCSEVTAHYKGDKYLSKIISTDPINDLALLQSDYRPGSSLSLSQSNPYLMQDIFVAGFPFGTSFSSSVKVTRGVVSSLTGLGDNFSQMQIDAALQPGNSGGPIVDETGSVVGIAVAKLDVKDALEDWGAIPENTNFGIKSTVVETFLQGNLVDYARGSDTGIPRRELAAMISENTLYLTCWMTASQIERMRSEKVMFTDLN